MESNIRYVVVMINNVGRAEGEFDIIDHNHNISNVGRHLVFSTMKPQKQTSTQCLLYKSYVGLLESSCSGPLGTVQNTNSDPNVKFSTKLSIQ